MRFGPILFPPAIVASIVVIVGSQSGWFDVGTSEPALIRADAGTHGAQSAAAGDVTLAEDASTVQVAMQTQIAPQARVTPDRDAVETGRSIRRETPPVRRPALVLGTGGAGLEADGAAKPVAAEPPVDTADATDGGRDAAAKAAQDIVNVTQASLAVQAAMEAEFTRQKAERDAEIGRLKAERDTQSQSQTGDGETIKRLQAELAAARETASKATADASGREDDLRRTIATLQASAADQARQNEARAGDVKPADPEMLAQLRDQLAAAEGREATLRHENKMLQQDLADAKQAAGTVAATDEPMAGRSVAVSDSATALAAALRTASAELAQIRAARVQDAITIRMLHRQLASLAPPSQGVHVRKVSTARRSRDAPRDAARTRHKRLATELASLQRVQMHQQVVALKKEADDMGRGTHP